MKRIEEIPMPLCTIRGNFVRGRYTKEPSNIIYFTAADSDIVLRAKNSEAYMLNVIYFISLSVGSSALGRGHFTWQMATTRTTP